MNSYDTECCDLWLKRSKSVDLDVCLVFFDEDEYGRCKSGWFCDAPRCLVMASAHCSRWEELSIRLENVGLIPLKQMHEYLYKLSLPALRKLELIYPFVQDYEEENDEWTEDKLHMYKSWSMPNLQTARFEKIAPRAFDAPALTRLEIKMQGTVLKNDFIRLSLFLSNHLSIEELLLEFDTIDVEDDVLVPPVTLPNVKYLRVDAAESLLTDSLLSLRRAIITPCVRKMEISVYIEDEETEKEENWLEFMLCHDEYPSLEDFTYDLDVFKTKFVVPFEKLPNLNTLKLRTPHNCPKPDPEGNRDKVPPLHALTIHGLHFQWEDWLTYLQGSMQKQNTWAGLREICIEEHGTRNGKFMKRFCSGKNLQVIEKK